MLKTDQHLYGHKPFKIEYGKTYLWVVIILFVSFFLEKQALQILPGGFLSRLNVLHVTKILLNYKYLYIPSQIFTYFTRRLTH